LETIPNGRISYVRTALPAATLVAVLTLVSPLAFASTTTPSPWTSSPPVPLPMGARGGELRDVTAIAPGDVWAVGSWTDSAEHPLAVHWDGTRWTDVPIDESAAPGRYRLLAVDSVAADDVWAVGSVAGDTPGAPDTTLVMHYTGGMWRVPPRLVLTPVAGALTGIDMVSADDGWVIGQHPNGDGTNQAMIMRYRAGGWVQVPAQLPDGAQLRSVYGSPSGEAWAVGSQPQPDGSQGLLIVHWDGAAWRTVVPPAVGLGGKATLMRVAGWSANDVWAVGSACGLTTLSCGALALHLSNGVWQSIPTSGGAELTGIAPQSPANVWVLGYEAFNEKVDTDHAEHWDGATLHADDSLHAAVPVVGNLGEIASALAAATPDHAGGLWAVGWTRQAGTDIEMPSAVHRM
jgi:hypothetical protein